MEFLRSGLKSLKSDEEIIASFKRSEDPRLIALLFDRYNHLVFAVSMKYLKNEEDSKDCVLRIFEKLPHDLLAYNIRHFASWLHTVTKNDCMHVLSSRKTTYTDLSKVADTVEEDDDFASNYLPHLSGAINELGDEQRICIDLFYLHGFSYQEVSDKTGFSMNQVKSHIQNGKRNLKNILLKKSDDK